MRKIGMIGVLSNPVKSTKSHNGGWTLAMKSLLSNIFKSDVEVLTEKDDWNEYNVLIINEGINYKEGKYNFFGGVQEVVKTRLKMISEFKGDLFCINEFINYADVCQKRKELIDFRDLEFRSPNIIDVNGVSSKVILGDSHSLSVYKPGYGIYRNDGKTLNGFLKAGISSYLKEIAHNYSDVIEELVFYAGNIDARFHFHRFGGLDCIDPLINKLEKQLLELNLNKISVCQLLPIEDEVRKIPKTGQYKGENFYGTKEERTKYVKYFNFRLKEMAQRNGFELLTWDFDYDQGLSFDNMELRQSVHLRPTSYMFANELIKNKQKTLF